MVAGIERQFELLRGEMREMRGETRELRAEMHAGFSSLQRQLAQIGWGMVGVLVTAMVAVIVVLG